jgi:hypothetical protein
MRSEHTCCGNFSQAVAQDGVGMDAETFQPSAHGVLENENTNLNDFTGICYDSIEAGVLLGQIATHALILAALSGESIPSGCDERCQQIRAIRL